MKPILLLLRATTLKRNHTRARSSSSQRASRHKRKVREDFILNAFPFAFARGLSFFKVGGIHSFVLVIKRVKFRGGFVSFLLLLFVFVCLFFLFFSPFIFFETPTPQRKKEYYYAYI